MSGRFQIAKDVLGSPLYPNSNQISAGKSPSKALGFTAALRVCALRKPGRI